MEEVPEQIYSILQTPACAGKCGQSKQAFGLATKKQEHEMRRSLPLGLALAMMTLLAVGFNPSSRMGNVVLANPDTIYICHNNDDDSFSYISVTVNDTLDGHIGDEGDVIPEVPGILPDGRNLDKDRAREFLEAGCVISQPPTEVPTEVPPAPGLEIIDVYGNCTCDGAVEVSNAQYWAGAVLTIFVQYGDLSKGPETTVTINGADSVYKFHLDAPQDGRSFRLAIAEFNTRSAWIGPCGYTPPTKVPAPGETPVAPQPTPTNTLGIVTLPQTGMGNTTNAVGADTQSTTNEKNGDDHVIAILAIAALLLVVVAAFRRNIKLNRPPRDGGH